MNVSKSLVIEIFLAGNAHLVSRYHSICAPLITNMTCAFHKTWFPLAIFLVTTWTKRELMGVEVDDLTIDGLWRTSSDTLLVFW